ncbi:MAG TPA: hypothetical protein VHS74_12330 [Solirubrobacterales bacterium]|jgi:hypothetical protein|nr:hypothetical protein [Solirubrobacterales bacterium]
MAIVATIQETYVLMGRAIQSDVPDQIRELAVRPEVIEQLLEIPIEYVTDEELLGLFQEAYFGLVENVLLIQEELLGERGEELDAYLEQAGLTDAGRDLKVGGFRRALDFARGLNPGRAAGRVRQFAQRHWVKKAFKWANIIIGSLGAVPVVGIAVEPIGELKDAIEVQGEEDQEGR